MKESDSGGKSPWNNLFHYCCAYFENYTGDERQNKQNNVAELVNFYLRQKTWQHIPEKYHVIMNSFEGYSGENAISFCPIIPVPFFSV